ncbi:MAG: bacteriohemerythrin [Sterolibacteriaceae bacterium]|uniref:Bacteriohemerythrin n=1 Tax=Candidatus Methylophosphatis roskildensis TaxID=2899263 RepID=A0A9D7E7T2_9PROT|nr:bacteriohemerythrin [Candidatus Methylophosphatis roskildensis]
MPPLPETLLAWLDEGTDQGVYVLSRGKLEYANAAFQAVLDEDALDLAEFVGRSRILPEHGEASARQPTGDEKAPLRLPSQPVRLAARDGAVHRLVAQEWLIRSRDGALIVGCISPPTDTADSDHALLRVALYDALTGLPNRSLLEDRLFQAIARVRRNGKLAALLYADLDGFKPVNDRHGHQAGDLVLQTVSGRMLACVRETDTVARIGGDEFAIVLEQPEHVSQVRLVAKKLIASVGEPIELPSGAAVCVSCSIGISLCPTNGMNLRALMNAADQAMYLSKNQGSGQFRVSAESAVAVEPLEWMDEHEAGSIGVAEIDRQHEELIAMANRLHHAIDNSESYAVQSSLLDHLISFAQFHFASEEALMDRYDDPGAEAHKRQHAQLIAQVLFFRHALSNSDSQMILSALRPWLIRHIRSCDRELGIFLQAQGVR